MYNYIILFLAIPIMLFVIGPIYAYNVAYKDDIQRKREAKALKKEILANIKSDKKKEETVKHDKKKLKELFSRYEALYEYKHDDWFRPKEPTMYRGVIKGGIADQVSQINNRMAKEAYNKDMEKYESSKLKQLDHQINIAYSTAKEDMLFSTENNMKRIIKKYPSADICIGLLNKYIKLLRKY